MGPLTIVVHNDIFKDHSLCLFPGGEPHPVDQFDLERVKETFRDGTIKERPKEVQLRQEPGHWETDTAVSRQSLSALQVSVERKTRLSKLAKLLRKGAHPMNIALTMRLRRYPNWFRTSITYDNGSENTEHIRTNKILGTRSYFCEPFHSWEKGTVENTIGLVRRFFPKKTDFAKVSKNRINAVERWLNNRPRKCLGFLTPLEAANSLGVALRG